MKTINQVILVLIIVGVAMGISFAISAGLTWLVCWSFDLTFTWKYALGVWVIFGVVQHLFRSK